MENMSTAQVEVANADWSTLVLGCGRVEEVTPSSSFWVSLLATYFFFTFRSLDNIFMLNKQRQFYKNSIL